jgi:hypothetical protein
MNAPFKLPELQFTEDGRKVYEPDGEVLCAFLQDRAHVSGVRGPIGSGKTLAMFNKAWAIACEQAPSPIDGLRKTRWGVVRNTFPDLEGTTLKDFLEWFPPEEYGDIRYTRPVEYTITVGDVRAEFIFMALDRPEDMKKLRSGQFTGFLFNESQYCEKVIFDEAESRTGRYPAVMDGGATWDGVLFDLNEPSEDHWLVQMTGEVPYPEDMTPEERAALRWPKEWKYYVQPPALLEVLGPDGKTIRGYRINPKAENLKWLKPNYYPEKVRGKGRRWIDSRLMNRISVWVDGKPVFDDFNIDVHVAQERLDPVKGWPILVGLDFGRSPAAVFAQLVNNRWYFLDELVAYGVSAQKFAPMVKRKLDTRFPSYEVRLYGDPKGADKVQSDERTAYDIFENFGMTVIPAPVPQNLIDTRLEAVAFVLRGMERGAPRWLQDPFYTRTLKVAMAGKYHYARIKGTAQFDEKPKKDRYSNVADAAQYVVLGEGEGHAMVGRPAQGGGKVVHGKKGRRSLRRRAA